MQDATPAFDDAMNEGAVAWVRPAVWADWANDGYGASGGIDDLSGQASGPIVVTHFLADGLPDDVSFVTGDEASTVTIPVAGRDGLAPSQYFSRLRTDSAVYGYERDVAPVKVEFGAVTSSGREYVRVFTGQMADTPTKGRGATVQAISGTRLKLAKSILPPPINGNDEGLTGTWPISWAMAECGVYVSPQPRSGCRYWAPMHGSLRAFMPSFEPYSRGWFGRNLVLWTTDGAFDAEGFSPPPETIDGNANWVDGPYLEAPNFRANSEIIYYAVCAPLPLVDGDPLWQQSGAKGRIEFNVRGDAIDVNSTPGGSAWWDSNNTSNLFAHVSIFDVDEVAPTTVLRVGIRRSDRKPTIVVTDAGGTYSLVGSTPLPTDGAWYGVGGAWDYTTNKLWLYYNGTVTSSSGYAMDTTNLLAAPDLGMRFHLPVAEVHVTGGTEANPDLYPWVFDAEYGWEASAVVGRSRLDLVALAEPDPSEAWEFIGNYARAELASLRTDELDRVRYLPLSWWVLNDLVDTPVDQLSTDVEAGLPGNVGDLDVRFDLAKIRNSATVTFSDTVLGTVGTILYEPLFELRSVVEVPPGLTVIAIRFDTPAVYVTRFTEVLTDDTIPFVQLFPTLIEYSWITANDQADGAGVYADSTQITFTVGDDWEAGGVTATIFNSTNATYYLANDESIPALAIYGRAVHKTDTTITVRDVNSIAIRGERTVRVDAPQVQTSENAAWLATAIVGEHAYPIPRVVNVEVFADPRRQPGDLARIVDTENTGLDDNFRLVAVKHTLDGGKYVQTVTGRQQKPTGVWDESNWDECVWAE